ncbi:MAG: hypothetical protein K8R36_15980 [Planctomycetales bacterium]|nr:hypothetical protein [Planctomycetales bacterium]
MKLHEITIKDILVSRHRLSEDILRDVKEAAASYGIAIARADVKDLAFPGNLQEVMNRVLAAERVSQAQLVEARTKSEVQRIEAQSKADHQRLQAAAEAESEVLKAKATAEATALAVAAETAALAERPKPLPPIASTPSSSVWKSSPRSGKWRRTPMLGCI